MSKFEKHFKKLLEVKIPVEPEQQLSDEDIWNQSFKDPKAAENFKTDPGLPGYETRYIARAKVWIRKLEEFADWINGTEENSLNSQFIELDKENSPFEGISSHTKKLTNIAGDLAALEETIKGYILKSKIPPEPTEPQ